MRQSVCTRIREHIVDAWLNGDARGFDDDSDLQKSGILDSFTTLSLASFLDETFRVEIDPVDINTESFRTVNTVADLVLGKLAQKASASSP